MDLSPGEVERFFSKVDTNGPVHPALGTPCHLWQGHCTKKGYGQFWLQGAARLANRVALVVAGRMELNDERQVLHRCDNPPCVNPDHLTPGTNLENVLDKLEKGRQPRRYSDQQIRTLRAISVDMTLSAVAVLFGCSPQMVKRIREYRSYKNITEGEE